MGPLLAMPTQQIPTLNTIYDGGVAHATAIMLSAIFHAIFHEYSRTLGGVVLKVCGSSCCLSVSYSHALGICSPHPIPTIA